MEAIKILYREGLIFHQHLTHCCGTVTPVLIPIAGQCYVFECNVASLDMGFVLGFEFSFSFGVCLFYSPQSVESGKKTYHKPVQPVSHYSKEHIS